MPTSTSRGTRIDHPGIPAPASRMCPMADAPKNGPASDPSRVPQWDVEFSPEYDVPRDITTHPEIYDMSSRDDQQCPTFCPRSQRYWEEIERVTLTVDHPIASARVIPSNPRFVDWGDNGEGDGVLDVVYSSETDFATAITVLLNLIK